MEILSDATFKGNVNFECCLEISNAYKHFLSFVSDDTGDRILIHTPTEFELMGVNYRSNGCVLRLSQVSGASTALLVDDLFFRNRVIGNSVSVCSLSLSDNYIYLAGIGKSITMPAAGGTLALTSDIPSLSDYQKKFTTFSSPSIPVNCTAFEFTGTAISDSNKTHLIQVQNTSTGKSVIAETWMTTNKKPAMSFAGCTSTVAAGTYTAIVL